MFEVVLFWLLIAGVVVAGLGHVWLLMRAFRAGLGWGLLLLFLPPASLVFLFARPKIARAPFALIGLGALVMAIPYGINFYFEHYVDLGPREKIVEGERHITLTGWDQDDYSILQFRRDTVVLQMANGDVSDQTLDFLKGMTKLRELDLNDTRITDDGLKKLAELPALASLRLRGTAITDAGFRERLMPIESLRELDLRKTAVSRPTVKEWRDAVPERRALR